MIKITLRRGDGEIILADREIVGNLNDPPDILVHGGEYYVRYPRADDDDLAYVQADPVCID